MSWLYERTRTNSVPHVKLGKCLRFDRHELAAWVDEIYQAVGPLFAKEQERQERLLQEARNR